MLSGAQGRQWRCAGRSVVTLDAVDRRIVELLVADGRMSVNELAGQAHVSRATAYARLERLRADGVITGFTATVDTEKLGYSVAALVLVNVDQSQWRQIRDVVLQLPGLEYLAFTSGGFDLVLLVRLPGISDLRDVVLVRLHDIEGVRSTQTIFVLDEARVSHVQAGYWRGPEDETTSGRGRRSN
jgi:DNA-binding Lrp family transcriptional regulator